MSDKEVTIVTEQRKEGLLEKTKNFVARHPKAVKRGAAAAIGGLLVGGLYLLFKNNSDEDDDAVDDEYDDCDDSEDYSISGDSDDSSMD